MITVKDWGGEKLEANCLAPIQCIESFPSLFRLHYGEQVQRRVRENVCVCGVCVHAIVDTRKQ